MLLAAALILPAVTASDRLSSFFPTRGDDRPAFAYKGPFEEEGAGKWRTWFIDSAESLLPPPPPNNAETRREYLEMRVMMRDRSLAAMEAARRWDEGPANVPWVDMHMEALGKHPTPPPVAARNLAVMDLALYDAMVATWHAKEKYRRAGPESLDDRLPALTPRQNPSYPSEHAAAAAAASRVLAHLYPADAAYYESLAKQAATSRVLAGVNFPSDVEAGLRIGWAAADAAIAARKDDGALESARPFPIDQIPKGPDAPYGNCTWKPTPTLFEGPWGVTMGDVPPFLLTDTQVNEIQAPPPPECDSPEYFSEHLDVLNHSIRDPIHLKDWAAWWHDHGWEHPKGHIKTDSLSVGGLFAPFLRDWVMMDDLSSPRSARSFALMHGAITDAFISVWRGKYTWWTERPVHVLPEKLGHTDWLPYIETPPFPGYPSGHSGQGGAAATMLSYLFPSRAEIAQGWGYDDARAREIVGVHPRFDDDEGHTMGVRAANIWIEWAKGEGAI